MTAGTGLKPTVAIAAKQNSSPRSMVKQVILDDSLARGTEQRTACTVITDHIAGKQNFRSPCEVLYSETTLFINYLVYRFLKRNQELSRAFGLFFVIRTDRNDLILFSDQFHRIRTDKLHLITRASPLESPRLTMHIAAHQGTVVHPFHHFQISAMYIDGIIHHPLIQPVARHNLTLTTGKMGRICLRGKITRIGIPFQTYAKFLKCNIFTKLCQQSHAFRIMYLHILNRCIDIMGKEYTGCRTSPATHGHHCPRH